MIQPEPEGSTQGYPLDSVEVLRFYTSAGDTVKEILLKLNLSDHRILKDGGEGKRDRQLLATGIDKATSNTAWLQTWCHIAPPKSKSTTTLAF
ncbi:hypothetical protein Tco_0845749 [Tanacetum coccineum]